MNLPSQNSLREPRRLGRVALTALLIGLGVAAVSALPLADVAFADKGGNGGGKGGGGGNGGGHGGGNGGGQGHGGGNGGGNANGHDNAGKSDSAGKSAKAGKSDDSSVDIDDDSTTASSDDTTTDDGSLQASKLGKLNGFFHASPKALAHASPNSAIGRLSQTFRDALSDFAEANQDETDTDTDTETDAEATPPTGPSVKDLGAILAGATNKPVTATQVQAIIDRLAEQNPDDDALNDLADNPDDETAQDIADAANAAKSGEPVDESDDGTDTSTDTDSSTDDGTGDTTGETPVTTATN